MSKSSIVFVVGAGASNELGLPLGAKLKEDISAALNIRAESGGGLIGDRIIISTLPSLQSITGCVQSALIAAARKVSGALKLAISIDNYLESNEGNKLIELMGKLAIVSEIAKSERDSPLFISLGGAREPDWDLLEKTWLMPLWKFLSENVKGSDVDKIFDRVKFVIFNYDRCVEQFLWYALQKYYDLSADRAGDLLSKATFHHPYGSLGQLDWSKSAPDGTLSFGLGLDQPSIEKIIDAGGRIKTFSERIEEDRQKAMIRDISDTETLVYLGFGFIEQNMQLLKLPTAGKVRRVFATAKFMSNSNRDLVEIKIRQNLSRNSDFPVSMLASEKGARELFDEYYFGIRA